MWLVLSLVVQLGSILLKPQNNCKGKLITIPMKRLLRWKHDDPIGNLFFRVVIQMLCFAFILAFFAPAWAYSLWVIALYLDDYMSDDDTFKRFRDMVRNKIKWKMELPKPVMAGSRVGY